MNEKLFSLKENIYLFSYYCDFFMIVKNNLVSYIICNLHKNNHKILMVNNNILSLIYNMI